MSHPGRLEGKVAIITGGGGGFGEGIVKKFTFEGAKVVVFDINESDAKRVAAEQPQGSAVGFGGDVSQQSAWKSVLDLVLKEFGHLDVVVNNAGVTYKGGSSLETPEKDFDRCINVHLKQVFHSTRVVVPYFIENNIKGLFINISSISAIRPRPGMLWYGMTKAGVTNATKGLALEFAPKGIRYNVIHPVAGETAMVPFFLGDGDPVEARKTVTSTIPLGRFALPSDIANAAAWLASDEASMITGASLDVDGGRGV